MKIFFTILDTKSHNNKITKSQPLSNTFHKTRKFEWMLDNTRIEKIISAPIWATNVF